MSYQRKTKIVATVGPASESKESLIQLAKAGVNVFRLNFSHGTHEDHLQRLKTIREISKELDLNLSILQDLQGPKIRTQLVENNGVVLEAGKQLIFAMDENLLGTSEKVGTTYTSMYLDVNVGERILMDDGNLEVKVISIDSAKKEVITEVIYGGILKSKKGINLPGTKVSLPCLTPKDEADLYFGLDHGVDWIALSFVRKAADIWDIKDKIKAYGKNTRVIAKIEKPQAVANLEGIVAAFDGIMVARGDLGVELPIEDVPLVQKHCIELARDAAKPVIVATQMLDSMITNSRPTRAEATDCANAVLDGADALMLSGETSIGEFAIEAVETMARIIQKTEEGGLERIRPMINSPRTKGGAITKAATEVGAIVEAKYLVAFTQSGDSARRMSRLRSPIPILALTPEVGTYNRLALTWGVEPMITEMVKHTDDMVKLVDTVLIQSGRAKKGENVMIVAGSPPGIPGSTNAMRVHIVGDAIGGVAPAYR